MPNRLPVSLYDAKAQFSRICEEVAATGSEVTVSRHGKPIVKIVPLARGASFTFGLAKGQFTVPDDFDASNTEIQNLFEAP